MWCPEIPPPLPPTELRKHLAEKLPDYMLFAAFVTLRALPLTPSGEIDRKSLPPSDASMMVGPKNVAPRNAVEARLTAMFAEVLGLETLGVTENFFHLGGYSLLAVRLLARIEQRFGKRLPLAQLFTCPTVAEMATCLRNHGIGNADWKSLVPITPIEDKPILFLVHGAGGNVLLYRELARQLAPEVATYGFQSQGLDRKSRPLASIEEMAAHYVTELCEFQPEGPYHLGGYCMGGAVAYEMARILRKQGMEVGIVALLDGYNLN